MWGDDVIIDPKVGHVVEAEVARAAPALPDSMEGLFCCLVVLTG